MSARPAYKLLAELLAAKIMHGSSLARMRWFCQKWLAQMPKGSKVLDVGSCDVAGGTYRQFFDPERFEYVGLDLAPGPNVDIVPERPYCWREIPSDSFDVVISGQAFEHIEFFWLTAAEMARTLKPGGLLCLIAPRGFARHRYPVDCYRFDEDGMIAICRWCNLEPLHASTDMAPWQAGTDWHIEDCEDSLLVARKPEGWRGTIDPCEYVFREADTEKLQEGFAQCPKIMAPRALMAVYQQNEKALARTQRELAELASRYERELAQKCLETDTLRKLAESYENSNSWRLTRPLRALRKRLKTLLGKH